MCEEIGNSLGREEALRVFNDRNQKPLIAGPQSNACNCHTKRMRGEPRDLANRLRLNELQAQLMQSNAHKLSVAYEVILMEKGKNSHDKCLDV